MNHKEGWKKIQEEEDEEEEEGWLQLVLVFFHSFHFDSSSFLINVHVRGNGIAINKEMKRIVIGMW